MYSGIHEKFSGDFVSAVYCTTVIHYIPILFTQTAETTSPEPFSRISLYLKLTDMGSNVGPYTLLASTAGYNVISIDPLPENQALLYNSIGQYYPPTSSTMLYYTTV